MWVSPRTYVPGVVVNAAMLNVHLRDNLNWLMSGEGWIFVSFQNGWFNGSISCQYRRIGGNVVFKGSPNGTALGVPIFTLPPGYRPNRELLFCVSVICTSSAPSFGDLRFLPNGDVELISWNSAIVGGALLNGIHLNCVMAVDQ